MVITWNNHSGHGETETFPNCKAALVRLQALETEDRREKEVAPTASGRITCDRWFQMVAFRKALGLPQYCYSE